MSAVSSLFSTAAVPVHLVGTRPTPSWLWMLPGCSIPAPEPRNSEDGDKFWRMPECYIRGSTIKYLRIPDEIIDMVKEEVVSKGRGRGGMQQQKQQKGRGVGGAGRGVFGGRGRGIPGSGRGQQEKKPGRQSAKQ
ncbi:U6 snRNA-associated Sm-like protein LSm4 isoform X2 [Oxyura jamaicensis]|uniref:U6 snRNA-associated Sm-like protein LSm4 isoform X2 n=1 Tax=Oxyura jamaicensis TaxID=8884 RepID=UPI0015A6B9D0|nr:U6 snRNA-associated Sm-like protein LSm4 isoform X2 [Oxyura jamaicensis]